MEISYRDITKADFRRCADGLVAAYEGAPWYNPWTKEEALLRIEATLSGFNARGYVAEVEGEVVAMCLGRVDYYYNGWRQFCIDEFNVRPEFQGKGVGSGLMGYVSDLLKKDGIARVFLMTGGERAADFYEKVGFDKIDEGTMMALEWEESA